jgi:hypothetical protein
MTAGDNSAQIEAQLKFLLELRIENTKQEEAITKMATRDNVSETAAQLEFRLKIEQEKAKSRAIVEQEKQNN